MVRDYVTEKALVVRDGFLEALESYVNNRKESGEGITIKDIAKWIRSWSGRGDILTILVQGLSGHGKTTLALKIAHEYYGSWKKALKFTLFDPVEIIALIINHLRQGKLVPLLVFDDAGAWLSKWGLTLEKRTFLEFTNLLRTSVGSIIYTDIYSVAKYIRDTVKLRIMVEKLGKNKEAEMGLDSAKEWSVAKVYVTRMSLRGAYYKHLCDIVFALELPPRVRSLYSRKREAYTARLASRLIKHLLEGKRGEKLLETEGGQMLLEEIYDLVGEDGNGDGSGERVRLGELVGE